MFKTCFQTLIKSTIQACTITSEHRKLTHPPPKLQFNILCHFSAIANENNNPVKHFHQNFTSVFTHVVWTLSSIIVYSGSLVFLLLLAYIEMFSNYLMDTGFKVNIHLLPFLIILSNIPVNIILYKIFINNKDSFSLAHAILSPIKPCRYEKICDNM